MNKELMFSSKTDNWATPLDFFFFFNKEFCFNLDPCADDENHKCEKYFTKIENGLLKDWTGHRVFCNPPYGREIVQWVKKASVESENALVVMLLPARVDTKWFHEYIYNKAEIRFVKGRLKFGDSKNSAPFPSMIVIFNNKQEE